MLQDLGGKGICYRWSFFLALDEKCQHITHYHKKKHPAIFVPYLAKYKIHCIFNIFSLWNWMWTSEHLMIGRDQLRVYRKGTSASAQDTGAKAPDSKTWQNPICKPIVPFKIAIKTALAAAAPGKVPYYLNIIVWKCGMTFCCVMVWYWLFRCYLVQWGVCTLSCQGFMFRASVPPSKTEGWEVEKIKPCLKPIFIQVKIRLKMSIWSMTWVMRQMCQTEYKREKNITKNLFHDQASL